MKKIILTTMCLVINKEGQYLVENRIKNDWPGLTLPGGHVEDNENIIDSVKREMKEETGLDIFNLINVGYIEWNEKDVRHLSILFKTYSFKGEIISSKEGKIFFINKEDLKKYPLSNDLDKILEKFDQIKSL